MPVDRGRLDRAMQGLTIGVARSMSDYLKEKDLEALREVDEQFQIQIEGRAEEFPTWDKIELKFDTRFIDATGQRPSPFDRPHFTYGAEANTDTTHNPVGIMACVVNWTVNDRGETVGCILAIGAVATDLSTKFKGWVHCTFQGWGAAPESVYGDVR